MSLVQPAGKVPATIVTGFLGAGKTTLIRHLLENAGGRRLALIINEFGDVGVDGAVLRGCGIEACAEDDVIELANGCLCCTVADDFVPAIGRLLNRADPPDHIIIETSGLALPKPLVQAFNWPDVRTRVTVDGVVAVVDADAVAAGRFAPDPATLDAQREAAGIIDHDTPVIEVFEDQLLCADLIVVSKTDLVTPETLPEIDALVRAEAPRGRILHASNGRIDPRILLGVGAAAEDDLANRPSHHDDEDDHDHEDFTSFTVDLEPQADPAALTALLSAVADRFGILRLKGFVEVRGKPMRLLVQGVGGRVQAGFDRLWSPGEEKRSRLVVIAGHGIDRDAVTQALAG